MELEITGLEAARRRLERARALAVVRLATAETTFYLLRRVAAYPPGRRRPRRKRRRRRRGRGLVRSWRAAFDEQSLVGVVSNPLAYARFVQDRNSQTIYNRRAGWRTVQAETEQAPRYVSRLLRRALGERPADR